MSVACVSEGVEYRHGDSWSPSTRPCDRCICYDGQLSCRPNQGVRIFILTPWPNRRCDKICSYGVIGTGSCCSTCTGMLYIIIYYLYYYQFYILFYITSICYLLFIVLYYVHRIIYNSYLYLLFQYYLYRFITFISMNSIYTIHYYICCFSLLGLW